MLICLCIESVDGGCGRINLPQMRRVQYSGRMEWMCFFSTVLLVVGLIAIAVRSTSANSVRHLSQRVVTLETQTRAQAQQIEVLRQQMGGTEGPAHATSQIGSIAPAKAEPSDLPPILEPTASATPEQSPAPVVPSPTPDPIASTVQPKKPLPTLPKIDPAPEPIPQPAIEPIPVAPADKGSFELQIGKVWLVRLGVLMVLTGLVYLARMGYEGISDPVRPYVNASLLYAVSFGMLTAGLWLHRRFESLKNYSEVLTGGGFAAVYFSTYALYFVEHPYLGLIGSPVLAGVLLSAWAIFIIVVATRRRSEVMAMFAIAGAYYASYVPLIHDATGAHAGFTLLSTVALAIAATVFVIRNRWANLPFLSLVTTFAGFGYWRFMHPAGIDAGFWNGAGFLTAYWIIFTLAALLTRHESMSAARRASFVHINNTAYFCFITFTLLALPEMRGDYWLFPLVYGLALAALHVFVRRQLPDEKGLANELLALAAVLIAVGIGLNFDLNNASWCLALMGLAFAGFDWAMRSLQLFGVGQLALWGGAAMVVPQSLLPGNELTWSLALIAPVLLLANGWVLDRSQDGLQKQFDLSGRFIVPCSAVAQVTAVLVGLFIAIKFVADERLLWMLPVIGIALSAGALMLRLTPALMAAQMWLVVAALFSPFKMMGADADRVLSFIPALAILGMSRFMLHARTLIDDPQSPLAKLAKANTSAYFLFGWLLMLAWGYSFVAAEYLFVTFTAVAIGHVMAHARRTRFERILVGSAFALIGWMMFGWHCAFHWNEPVAWDGLAIGLLLGAQYFARKRDTENIVPNVIHALVIVAMNLSLWVWASRMVPGDLDVLTWGLLAGILIGLGLYAAERAHRIFGLVIMLAATANLVFLAWSKLDGVPRILTFMGLGVILIVLSGLYHKYQEKLKEYL